MCTHTHSPHTYAHASTLTCMHIHKHAHRRVMHMHTHTAVRPAVQRLQIQEVHMGPHSNVLLKFCLATVYSPFLLWWYTYLSSTVLCSALLKVFTLITGVWYEGR